MDFTCTYDVRHSYTTHDLRRVRSSAPKLDSQLCARLTTALGLRRRRGRRAGQHLQRHRQSTAGDPTAKLKVKPILVVANFPTEVLRTKRNVTSAGAYDYPPVYPCTV